MQALPVFALFSLVAALLEVSGAFEALARCLSPALHLLGLPGDVAMALVMASVRKDGILLLTSAQLSKGQLLVAAYLASTLTPCLVTAWLIARTRSLRGAASLLRDQFLASLAFTAILAAVVALAA
jgi:ferrous iron transport protein B